VAGQIARISRCRAIGIAGGPDKCRWIVSDLGFDAAIDYKAQDVAAALREHAPGGVDVFFDNVGGEILDAVLSRLARGARIVLSGGLSQYAAQQVRGPSNYLELIAARASMTGFLTPDYAGRYAQARARAGRLAARGAADLPRRHPPGRRRCLPGRPVQAVRRAEHRQAGTRRAMKPRRRAAGRTWRWRPRCPDCSSA
jgi:NADPH-dependent curcumin reductase CurA